MEMASRTVCWRAQVRIESDTAIGVKKRLSGGEKRERKEGGGKRERERGKKKRRKEEKEKEKEKEKERERGARERNYMRRSLRNEWAKSLKER